MKRLGFAAVAAAAVASWAAPVAAQPAGKPAPKPKAKPTSWHVEQAYASALGDPPTVPEFGFTLYGSIGPADGDVATDFEHGFDLTRSTVGLTADGKAAWIAADMAAFTIVCGDETCPDVPKPDAFYHGTMVLEGGGETWRPLSWLVDEPITAAAEKRMRERGKYEPTVLERKVRKGAEAAVALFESSIGDPKVLAKTVSSRADVVLYGSQMKERFVGGKKVAAQLARWNLALANRDGIQAGASANGQLAWVAANVDATSLKKKDAKPSSYRALFVYLNDGGRWQLVVAHFGI